MSARTNVPPWPDWTPVDDAGFIDLVGPIWRFPTGEGPGFGLAFVAEARHANLLGVVQGGMLMTVADRALGLGAWEAAGGKPCVTVQFSMQFVSAARLGELLSVTPVLVRATATLAFMRGDVRAGERTVAAADGVWRVLDGPRPPAPPSS